MRCRGLSGSEPDALLHAGHLTLALRDTAASREYFEQGLQRLSGSNSWFKTWGTLALAGLLQRAGDMERAEQFTREAARQLELRSGGSPKRPEDYIDLASIHVLQGDRDAALQAFEKGVHQGWRFYNDLGNEAILESLRGNPLYDRLMAKVQADVARQRARVEKEGW